MLSAKDGAKPEMKLMTLDMMCFEKATTMKTTWMDTLLTAFPISVGRKNVMKGI